jgi:hypothetical protein
VHEQGGFDFLNLPAIAQRDEKFELDDCRTYTRRKGEIFHADREPAYVLANLKRTMGPIAFSTQYQQAPIPPGGTFIKREWLLQSGHAADRGLAHQSWPHPEPARAINQRNHA